MRTTDLNLNGFQGRIYQLSHLQNSENAGGDKPAPTKFIVGEGFIPSH
jgi:hypothetical protein